MADQEPGAAQAKSAASATEAAAKAPKGTPNPVFKMMGLPTFRLRLPSRNWTIFLTIVGSWTAAVVYDRRQKKKIQQKWSKLVSHLADERMETSNLPRKLTVYVESPPGDGLTSSRDHFHEYVKPILVAAALDWDAVEGRREGDIRAGLAEKIRKMRKINGESAAAAPLEEDVETAVLQTRVRAGIKPVEGVAGDIVIGRHTWKEYVRGLHEGWLGPLEPPAEPTPINAAPAPLEATPAPEQPSSQGDDASPTTAPDFSSASSDIAKSTEEKPAEEKEKEKEKPKTKKQPPPFIATADYPTASLAPTIPYELPPSIVIQQPHILGFLNTPIRMYRFLNRRKLADDIGRQTAAAVFAVYRPYHSATDFAPSLDSDFDNGASGSGNSEQERLLQQEEKEWHKSVRDRSKDDGKERPWLDDMVLDSRIAERMQKFELSADEESRANEIAARADPWWKEAWGSLTGGDVKKESE